MTHLTDAHAKFAKGLQSARAVIVKS